MSRSSDPGSSAETSMLLERFEQAWLDDPPADLAAHVPPPGDPNRAAALYDLVHIDLEYRWKQGTGVPVETYLERYPELRRPDTILDLALWEFEMRRRVEPGLNSTEYARRFPEQARALADRLAAARADEPEVAEGLPEIVGFEILRELGVGGMGVVYEARQLGLGRRVALKMIRADLSQYPQARVRFETEARSIAQLDHPGIVRVHDFGIHCGQPYLVLELVEGGTLAQFLHKGPLPPSKAADLVAHLADAVQHAHEAGIIHRDLKPTNVLVRTDPQGNFTAKIADFGLARNVSLAVRTMPGDFLGTPAYAAPEQARGETDSSVPTVDVFGLGAILYECLTGKPPFQGTTREEALRQAKSGTVLSPGTHGARVPGALERILMRALSPDPTRRYGSARELAQALKRYLRPRWLLAQGTMAAGVVGVLAWLGFHTFFQNSPPPEGNDRPVRVSKVRFLATTTVNGQKQWHDVRARPAEVLPLRNGELIRVEVEIDRPGYIYILYFDDGAPIPLSPWNDLQPGEKQPKLRVKSLKMPPPDSARRQEAYTPGKGLLGWPLQGKSSLDGLLILAHRRPLRSPMQLAELVRSMKPVPPPTPDWLAGRSSPPLDDLMFDYSRGQLEDRRGLGEVPELPDGELLRQLQPLFEHFDAVAAFQFAHEGS